MKLIDLLKTLSGNELTNITLIDDEGVTLITFNAAGYGAVESDLGNRGVKKIKIDGQASISIILKEAETEPTEPSEP